MRDTIFWLEEAGLIEVELAALELEEVEVVNIEVVTFTLEFDELGAAELETALPP